MAAPFNPFIISPVLIGRAAHLDALVQLIEQAWRSPDPARPGQSNPKMALISGEAGVGKSRLAAEAQARLRERNSLLTLQGRCFEHDHALPYAPLLDLLRLFSASCSPGELVVLFGPAAPEIVRLLPELSELFPTPTSPPILDPEQEKRRLHQALAQFFTRLAEQKPLLVMIEDVHWSDEASLEFLLYLTRQVGTRPLCLMLTYRSEEVGPSLSGFLAALDREHLAAEFILPRLIRDDVDRLIRAIFNLPRPVRMDFLDAIYALTDGNPFFIEEVLKTLIAAGDIFYTGEGWDRKPLNELHIPRTVQVAVQQRTDQVSQPARDLLALAAVAGRRFDFALLQQVTQHDELALLSLVKELIAAQLVVEESAETFAFRHALTRQAVYADMLARERRAMHHSIAEAMERIGQPTLPDLAYHFYEAGVWAKVLEYAPRAGEQARALHSPRAVVEHFTQALEAAQQTSSPTSFPQAREAALYRVRGSAYETLGEFEHARADYQAALELAHQAGDQQAAWQSLLDLGMLWASRDYAQTGDYFQQALNLAREMGDPATLAHTLNRLGNWHLNNERPLEAQLVHHEARRIFETLGDPPGLAETLDLLGTTYLSAGNPIEGAAYYRQAIPIFRELNDHLGIASGLCMLSQCGAHYLGNVTGWAEASLMECVQYDEEAIRIAREIGWRSGEALGLAALASPLGFHGEYERALQAAQAGLTLAEEIEHHYWMIYGHLILGAIYLDLLALPSARRHFEQALAQAQESGSHYWIGTITGFLTPTCILQGELSRAAAALEAVLTTDTPASNAALTTMSQRQSWCACAELALAQGEPGRALQIVEMLISSAVVIDKRDKGAVPRLANVRGQALAALGQAAEAETVLQAGREVARRQGIRSLVWRLHIALGRLYRDQRRLDEAEREWSAARRIIAELAANAPAGDLRDNFVSRATALIPPAMSPSPRQAAKQAFGGLTGREREVAALIAQGKSNRAIAEELVVSERTVEKHVENIMSKLGFDSRAQVAVWVVGKESAREPGSGGVGENR